MTISNRTLVQIASWGGLALAATGFYLQGKLVTRVQGFDYYRAALKKLRTHPGAIYYLGEPIKDRRFKITDSDKNFSDNKTARFCIPVVGSKERGYYYFWAEKTNDEWTLIKAELELKSKPDERLLIYKS